MVPDYVSSTLPSISSISSEGQGPIFKASEFISLSSLYSILTNCVEPLEYSPSGHALPFPLSQVDKKRALALWTPPPAVKLESPTPHVVPARGALHVYKDLGSSTGVASGEFWNLWKKCEGCSFIVFGPKIKMHVCDLTRL